MSVLCNLALIVDLPTEVLPPPVLAKPLLKIRFSVGGEM